MTVQGLDHIVLRVKDPEATLRFYGDLLGLEKLRVPEWRAGKVGFPSVRVSAGTIIDLFPAAQGTPGEGAPRNLDHFCLVVAPEGWSGLLRTLQQAGVAPEGEPRQRWGARGSGTSVYIRDPEGTQIELKCYPEKPQT
jgi:catechol 2,3-dioxygenase-like lactoylglutathione lyase family enzyme